MSKTNDVLEAVVQGQAAILEFLKSTQGGSVAQVASEPDGDPTPQPVTTRTRIVASSPELLALRGMVKQPRKANLADKCAKHSPAALQTFVLAGSRAAREYMRGERKQATAAEDFALVPGSTAHKYAMAVADGGPAEVKATTRKVKPGTIRATLETGKVKAMPKGKREPKAKPDKSHDGMSDAQLLQYRPKDASQAPAAIRTWIWRKREIMAGRDPYRSK